MDSVHQQLKRPRIPRWLWMLVIYTLSAVCFIWALRGYDFSQIRSDIERIKWGWVALAIVLDLAVYVFHGWRWNTILSPVEKLGLWRTVQAIYVGLFANEILP